VTARGFPAEEMPPSPHRQGTSTFSGWVPLLAERGAHQELSLQPGFPLLHDDRDFGPFEQYLSLNV
jgi:hypothetical protein